MAAEKIETVVVDGLGLANQLRDEMAKEIAELVGRHLSESAPPQPVGRDLVDQAVTMLLGIYDARDAGFGAGGNKFPMPAYLDLLMVAAWQR